jgi:hypothetical protein
MLSADSPLVFTLRLALPLEPLHCHRRSPPLAQVNLAISPASEPRPELQSFARDLPHRALLAQHQVENPAAQAPGLALVFEEDAMGRSLARLDDDGPAVGRVENAIGCSSALTWKMESRVSW